MRKQIQMFNPTSLMLAPILLAALTACQNSRGGGSAAPVDTNAVTGSWQVDGVMKNGTKSETDQGGTPNDEGYKVKANTLQFKITPKHFTTIHSDGFTSDVLADADYTVIANQLVLKAPSLRTDVKAFAILSIDSSSMTVQPASQDSDIKTVYHLKRIDESQLATLALSPIQQNLEYSISGAAPGDLGSASFKNIPASSLDNQGHILACQYQKASSPAFNISLAVAKKADDGSYTYSSKDENLMLAGNLAFDFTKASESIDIKIGGAQKASLVDGMHVSTDAQGAVKSSALTMPDANDTQAACQLHVDRADRDIKFTLSCPKISLGSATGKLDVSGNCLLMFSDFSKAIKGKNK